MARARIDRASIFQMLALNWDRKKIKKEGNISERTFWNIRAEYNGLSEDRRSEVKTLALREEKVRARFEDYELVKKWQKRLEADRVKNRGNYFRQCRRVWEILQKKNPENWTLEDINLRAKPELRKRCKKSIFHYLVALRSLKPDFKFPEEKTGEVLSTKGAKGKISIAWKYIYQRIVQEGLVEKFFESARIGSENPLRDESLVRTHVTLGTREGKVRKPNIEPEEVGGILNLRWEKINWKARTIDVYESKTGGGFYWLDCPLDLFGDTCFNMLKEYWVQCGQPQEGRIYPIMYAELLQIYDRIAQALKMKIKPHFARKLHACLCRKAGIKLEIVAGDPPYGLVGVGWEDLTILRKFYLAFDGKEVKEARMKARKMFNGEING